MPTSAPDADSSAAGAYRKVVSALALRAARMGSLDPDAAAQGSDPMAIPVMTGAQYRKLFVSGDQSLKSPKPKARVCVLLLSCDRRHDSV